MVKGQNKCARHSRPYSIIIKYCDIKGKNELMIRISGQEEEKKDHSKLVEVRPEVQGRVDSLY